MACTIVATALSASANSYCTIAEADTYHETHLYADDWNDADDTQRCQALQMATRLLDTWFDWAGSPVGSTQALLWPRVGTVGPNGYALASDVVPVLIKNATAELARQLIASNRTADSETETQGLKSLTAGPVSLTFGAVSAKPIPDAVMALCSWLGTVRSRTGSGGVTMRRG